MVPGIGQSSFLRNCRDRERERLAFLTQFDRQQDRREFPSATLRGEEGDVHGLTLVRRSRSACAGHSVTDPHETVCTRPLLVRALISELDRKLEQDNVLEGDRVLEVERARADRAPADRARANAAAAHSLAR